MTLSMELPGLRSSGALKGAENQKIAGFAGAGEGCSFIDDAE
jgi:hypothetical protein